MKLCGKGSVKNISKRESMEVNFPNVQYIWSKVKCRATHSEKECGKSERTLDSISAEMRQAKSARVLRPNLPSGERSRNRCSVFLGRCKSLPSPAVEDKAMGQTQDGESCRGGRGAICVSRKLVSSENVAGPILVSVLRAHCFGQRLQLRV